PRDEVRGRLDRAAGGHPRTGQAGRGGAETARKRGCDGIDRTIDVGPYGNAGGRKGARPRPTGSPSHPNQVQSTGGTLMIQKTPKTAWELAGQQLGNYLDEDDGSEIPLESLSMASLDALKRACECRLALRLGRRPTFEECGEQLVSLTELYTFLTIEERE